MKPIHWALGLPFLLSIPAIPDAPAVASGKFYCGSYDGVPSTMTNSSTSGKPIPIIMWKSTTFSSDGWAPEKRCAEVSSRFNALHASGRLKMLTTGRINGMPVICAATEEGGGCVEGGLLYTLKPGQNAGATLRNLVAVRTKATGPLTETTERPYISLSAIEAAAEQPDTSTLAGSQSSALNKAETGVQPLKGQPSNPSAGSKSDALW